VLEAATPTLAAMRAGAVDAPAVYRELDATLGHPGLPQSATGQSTLLTGVNAADAMSGHYGPWPGPTLRRLLDAGSVFADAARAGGASLANAYPPGYFAAREAGRVRPNAVAYAALAAGLRQRGEAEYAAGEAVPSDLHGAHLRREGGPLGPEGSARVLSELATRHALTLLDVWLTDAYGHARDYVGAKGLLERLDTALRFLVADPLGAVARGVTLLITSDHGNVEDLSVPTHTRNPVPLYAVGPGAEAFAGASSLLDVAPALRELLAG
jgi:hypothetical protein